MNIVYVFDKNYIPYYKISVKSLLKHNPKAKITVVSPEPLDLGVENIVMKSPIKRIKGDRITEATYLKCMLPKLPYDKIIFIDADTIVQKSLAELWKKDIPYIAMAQTHKVIGRQKKEHNHDKYFLSGVMVMNLKAMREDKFTEKCFKPFDFDGVWQHEETIINHYFYDKITELDKKYNYCHNRKYEEPIPECSAVILHYCGGDKTDMEYYKNLRPIKEFLKDKTVAIVGNAQSLFSERYGSEINKHDVIIRFTHGYITNPEAQGSKTTILISAEDLDKKRIREYNPLYIINRRQLIGNGTEYYFTNEDKNRVRLGLDGTPSSGILAIDLCDVAGCKKIDLYGFDWERTKTFYNPDWYKTEHNYSSEEMKIRIDYDVNIHGNFKLKVIRKSDKVALLEAKKIDEKIIPKAEIITIRGKAYKICPKCNWKHIIEETECRYCGSQL